MVILKNDLVLFSLQLVLLLFRRTFLNIGMAPVFMIYVGNSLDSWGIRGESGEVIEGQITYEYWNVRLSAKSFGKVLHLDSSTLYPVHSHPNG